MTTNRRTFLTQAGLIGAGLVLAPGLLSAKSAKKAGLQLYSLRDELPKDVKGVIAKVAAAGYKEVETYGYSKDGGFWGLSPVEFKALLDKHGLTSPSGHYNMDALIKEGNFDEVDHAIEAAKILKQEYVTCPYIGGDDRKSAADLKNIVEKVKLGAQRVKQAGLKMAYHNHDFEFETIEGVRLYDLLLDGTKPGELWFELDLYWVVRAKESAPALFKRGPGRFKLVHVKDMDKQDPGINTEVGSGSIDFKAIFAAAKKGGVNHFIVEQENFSIDPYKSITQSSTYLRTVLFK
ncbi:sugar phosphate isomerase/epimerase [uncultured Chitinophaga sp.]|uniref:sugar phosphate isomerase/epimerase family protein n=1 Tax=uncultured Chitinophaga sp. TaxID=339340 RepID=UPI0025D50451|nr:sugar phosphate isomerase/epimerase [uncultured Chitinophaga sp.]